MKQLCIVKTPPNKTTSILMDGLSQGKETTRFNLYEDQDYDKLVQLIFSHDEIISWW